MSSVPMTPLVMESRELSTDQEKLCTFLEFGQLTKSNRNRFYPNKRIDFIRNCNNPIPSPSLSLPLPLPSPLSSSYYYALVQDPRGDLAEAGVHLLIILLDCTPPSPRQQAPPSSRSPTVSQQQRGGAIQTPILNEPGMTNLFCGFVSRLHQNDVSLRSPPVQCIDILYVVVLK